MFFELRFMASDGSDQDARYALSELLQRGTVAEYETRAMEARFTNHQLWKLLRSYPLTVREAFFRARITEARFEDENNQAFDTNIGDPGVKDKQEAKKADDQEIGSI
nr:hypothetical protein [Tanacetum cinerariifolium]